MNKLIIGLADKTPELRTKPGFLLIDDGPIADVFLSRFKRARLFDPQLHSFDPLKDITPRKAQDFADLVYPDKDLMTYRDGKSAMVRMLLVAKRHGQFDKVSKSTPNARMWIPKQRLIRELLLTQSGARIFELKDEHHWNIEHSSDTDAHGFKSYRILQKVTTLPML